MVWNGNWMSTICFTTIQVLFAVSTPEWPDSDMQLDMMLKKHSPKYKSMAQAVQARQSYRISATDDFPLGNVKSESNTLVIELNPEIPKDRRATVLLWEMANAYQRDKFDEIHRRALAGEITSRREYGLRMELVEYGSHQHHLEVLRELSRAGFRTSENVLYFLNPKLKSLDEYRIPSPHDYLDANAKSGHTKHYEDWYDRIPGKGSPAR
jgi:hypothetical protein